MQFTILFNYWKNNIVEKNKIYYKLKVSVFIYIKQNLLAHWKSVSATETFVRLKKAAVE